MKYVVIQQSTLKLISFPVQSVCTAPKNEYKTCNMNSIS